MHILSTARFCISQSGGFEPHPPTPGVRRTYRKTIKRVEKQDVLMLRRSRDADGWSRFTF